MANTAKREDTSDELRERLIQLVHDLDHDALYAVERFATFVHTTTQDSFLQLLYNAPIDNEPVTVEEEALVQEARDQFACGEYLTDEEVRQELGHEQRG